MRQLDAVIKDVTGGARGGFTAIASSPTLDRDGEIIDPGAFEPLPATIPCHADHQFTVQALVARASPYYEGSDLLIDATFTASAHAQEVRQLVRDGALDSVSVAFIDPERYKDRQGVTHVKSGELVSCDIVTVASNRQARILSTRSLPSGREAAVSAAYKAIVEARVVAARAQLADAVNWLRENDPVMYAGFLARRANRGQR